MKPAHQPRHARPGPRHARPRPRRRTGPAIAWVGVLAVAGFVFTPEPAAPAAQLVAQPVARTVAVAPVRTASMTVDEPHRSWQAAAATPAAPPAPRFGARWGTDVGWPQCGHRMPGIAVDFTVIQVTSGRPGTVSPCLAEQVAWARSTRSVVNAYVVPGSPSAADLVAADRRGSCHGQRACQLRAAGASDAAHALAGAKAAGLSARGWWLDVEDVPERTLWGTDTAANTQVLIGWRDELRRAGRSVGVYSTGGYWRQVAGHWQAGLPQWVAVGLAGVDAASRACDRTFTSGPVLMTQWLTGPLDGNLLCGGRDRLAADFFGHFARTRTAGVPDLLVIPVPHPDIEAAQRAQAQREAEQARKDQQAKEAAQAAQRAAAKRAAARRAAAAAASTHQATPDSTPAATPGKPRPPTDPTPPPPARPAPAPSEPAPSPSGTSPPPTTGRG